MGQDKTITISNQKHGDILNLEKKYFTELEKIFKSEEFCESLLKIEKWTKENYRLLNSWGKVNKVQLPCQRIINYHVMNKIQQIVGVYNSAISADIAFETKDAIINIDSKTVSSTGNRGDFESLFFGPNQSSFKHKKIGVSKNKDQYPGLPVIFELPSSDILTKKPILTFFLMIKYTDVDNNFEWYSKDSEPNIRFMCIPNGDLSYLFKNEIISNPKTYAYAKKDNKNNKKVDKTHPLSYSFQNSIPIRVNTKEGFYNLNTQETWLETNIKGGKVYKQAISTHSCRIDFLTLKDRYDASGNVWEGIKSWVI